MQPIFLLTILIVVIVVAIAVSGYANVRQQKQIVINKTLNQMRSQAELCQELAGSCYAIIGHKAIAAKLLETAIAYYRKIASTYPNQNYIETAASNAEEFLRTVRNEPQRPLKANFESSQEISIAKSKLESVQNVLHKMYDGGELGQNDYETFRQDLKWYYLEVEVAALLHQANLARQANQTVKYLSLHQKALNLLKRSALDDPRKRPLIQQIASQLSHRQEA